MTTGLSPGRQARFVPGCPLVDRRLFVSANPSHSKDVREYSVYIGFRLFVLLESRSSDVSAIPWRVHGTYVPWPNKSIGTQSCSTLPGRSARRPDPTRPWYVRVLDSTGFFLFLDMPCMKKMNKYKQNIITVVGSQETQRCRCPADKPLINCGSTVFLFLLRFTSDFLCSCLRNDFQVLFSIFLSGQRRQLLPCPTVLSA